MRTPSLRGLLALSALLFAMLFAIALGARFRRLPLRLYVALGALVTMAPAAATAIASGGRRGGALALAGLAAAPMVTLPTWLVAHPVVHFDNATGEAIQLWIDGARGPLLAPGAADAEPPHLRLPAGERVLGWSRPGEGAPRETTVAAVAPLDEHLYNPAGAGCYWIQVATYGDGSARGTQRGPQRVAAFYRFDRVDRWFAPAAEEIRVPRAFGGAQRVVVQRHRACMELAALGCDPGQRSGYVACQRTLTGPGEPIDCFGVAQAVCAASALARGLSARR